MSLHPILRHPDPVLRQPCAPVSVFDADLRDLARDMFETMYAAPGRGLAAPQVGVTRRLFVMDVAWKTGAPAQWAMVNPELVEASDTQVVIEEGCLSIPDTPCLVRRPASVRLRWHDLEGRVQEALFEGAEARCAQHEMDHLDGILCIDRVEPPA